MVDLTKTLPRHPTKHNALRPLLAVKKLVLHTTDAFWTPRQLAEYDVGPNHISDTGCPSITYHDLVMNNGTVYHTLPYEEVSWHVGKWNQESVGVALMYKCTDAAGKDRFSPNPDALTAAIALLADLCRQFKLPSSAVMGHRELPGYFRISSLGTKLYLKTCPGLLVDCDDVRNRVEALLTAPRVA